MNVLKFFLSSLSLLNLYFFTLPGFHSTMIRHIPSYQDALMGWLAAAGFGDKYWVPCFHGEHNSVFHSGCDQRGPTVTLARKDSHLFGGFADRSWRSKSFCFLIHF